MKPLWVLSVVSVCAVCLGADVRSGPLPRSSPEKQGISSAAVLAFVDAADRRLDTMNSFMLVRHGQVVAEAWWTPYDARTPHMLYSLSKSFTSTAVGLAIAEGKLSLNDAILKFFPEDAPAQPGENLKAMRIRDLLRMSTGHQSEPSVGPAEAWTKTFVRSSTVQTGHPFPVQHGRHLHALGRAARRRRG